MAKIHLLDELTANQISAGEVIERPASVVKELVENALDARASNISVDINNGGLSLIRVIDDGSGMSKEDVQLAVKRHATSKLRIITDLNELRTLGFRGEALPSITAVARVEIITREHNEIYGTRLIIEGNNLTAVEPAGGPEGTQITVRDLFYNTPARKSFMRSEGYEGGLIHELMIQFSLGHPDVNFRFIHQQKEILNTAGINSLPDLLELFYGKDVKSSLLMIDSSLKHGHLNSYLTLPTFHRVNRKGIHFYINSRRVLAKDLIEVLNTAYENMLPKSRFPVAVTNLDLPGSLIDVNVHPSKLEVRFRDKDFIREISALIKQNLLDKKAAASHLLDFKLPPQVREYHTKGNVDATRKQNQINKPGTVQETWKDFYTWGKNKNSKEEQINSIEKPNIRLHNENISDLPIEMKHEKEVDSAAGEPVIQRTILPPLRVIGQLSASFILAEGEEGLYLIDQHAAHERIIFEKILKQADKGVVNSQVLLNPIALQLTVLEEEIVIENILPLTDLGIILENFGPRSYLLRAVPTCLKSDPQDFFHSLLQQFGNKTKKPALTDIRKDYLIMLSCKSAIKAGQKLSQEAMVQLISDLNTTDNAMTCPHGRPLLYHIPYTDILKAFRRI